MINYEAPQGLTADDLSVFAEIPSQWVEEFSPDLYEELILATDKKIKSTTWWNWTLEQWTAFVQDPSIRQINSGNERILLEYGNWLLTYPNATDREKISAIENFVSINHFYWEVGLLAPDLLPE